MKTFPLKQPYLVFIACSVLCFLSVYGQEAPPIRNYTPADYGAENQNWSISQDAKKHLYFANNKGLLEFNGANWNLYPTPNNSIIRSVKVIDSLIYTGCFMEFGYWKRDRYGRLRYASISDELKTPLLEDEEFWGILNYKKWVLFQSLNRIYIYDTVTKAFKIINSQNILEKIFKANNKLYFQKRNEGLFSIENGKEILVSDHAIVKNNILVGIYKTDKGVLLATQQKGLYWLTDASLKKWSLKKNAKTLPLTPDQKVLVTGYAAHTINVLNGAWSRTFLGRDTRYNDPTKLTILEAIQKKVGSENVRYAAGTDYTNDLNVSEAVKLAKEVDCIVVCLGEIPATEKPSDIDELELPKVQQDLVEKLAASQKPIVLVLVQGRPRIIREIEPLTEAIVMAYLPGQEGGRAVSDVLYGAINPSGKLPYTYPKYSGNALPYYHKKADIRDIHWGYEGFDPQYEFGHGLSYASFAYSAVQTDKDTLSSSETLRLQVAVENTGSRTGKEVVQVYLKDLVATVSPDVKKLVRFKKIELEPGEKKNRFFSTAGQRLFFHWHG
jgi:hypothetical protein